MSNDNINGLLYLYNGKGQPEIWSVNTMEQALQYAANFSSARLEVSGQDPVELPGKPPPCVKETKADFYDWRKVRSGSPNGAQHDANALPPTLASAVDFPF